MPCKRKRSRKSRVDLVDLMLRNRTLINPYNLRKQRKLEPNEKRSKYVNTTTRSVESHKVMKNGQESPRDSPRIETQSNTQSVHSYNLRKRSIETTNTSYENMRQQQEHSQDLKPKQSSGPESKPIKKSKFLLTSTEKFKSSSSKFIRKGTPRPTPRPTTSKLTSLKKEKTKRSTPYKRCGSKAKWRSFRTSKTRNKQLMADYICTDSTSMISGSRLYLAEVALQSAHAPDSIRSTDALFGKRLLSMQETESTVILHRNPNFGVRKPRRSKRRSRRSDVLRSGIIDLDGPQCATKTPNSKDSSETDSASSGSTTENSKSTTEESNSFDGNVDEVLSATITGVLGERKDQELRPPPMVPQMEQNSCGLNCYPQLAAILHSMDNFLKSVTKSAH